MMAFFLLMWLLSTASKETRKGIADYFAPASVAETTSGNGGILGGKGMSTGDGPMQFEDTRPPQSTPSDSGGKDQSAAQTPAEQAAKQEEQSFQSAAESLRQALKDMPELAELSKNILVDQTPEGLRIQLIDQEGSPMFEPNSTKPNTAAQALLKAVAKIVNKLPNRISITGHTSATPGQSVPSNTDWQVSAERADASRATLQSNGVDQDRIAIISGKATKDPLYPDDPTLPGNRRIAIVLLREAPVLPNNVKP